MAIFLEYLQKFMAIFVDDFTVYSSITDHLSCLKLMMEKCREKRVCLNPYKSLFGANKGVLLGHVVSKKGIEMADDKVKAILEAVAPTNANEIASFLGYVKVCGKTGRMGSTHICFDKKGDTVRLEQRMPKRV